MHEHERYIGFNYPTFRGFVNIDTGDIFYSKLSPKYHRVLHTGIKLNVNDKETYDNREILNTVKAKLKNFKGNSNVSNRSL